MHSLQITKSVELPNGIKIISEKGLPDRRQMLAKLQQPEEYDVLIIGGGATGGGIAVSSMREEFKFYKSNLNLNFIYFILKSGRFSDKRSKNCIS